MDRQKITVDLALSSSSHIIAKLVSYIVITILARYLTKEDMGAFFFAATLATFFALFTDLGTNKYLNREVSEKPANSLLYLSEVFSLRLVLQVIFLFALYGFTVLTKPEIITTVILTSIYIFLENLNYSFTAFFLGLRNVKIYALTTISAKLLLAVLVLVATGFNASLNLILLCYIIANAFLILFSLLQVRRISGPMDWVWDWETEARIIRISLPFFLVTFLTMLQLNIDTLMLGFMQPYADVATYTSGFKMLEVSQFVIRPLVAVFFPISARLAVQGNWSEFKTLFQRLLLGTGIFGLLVAIGILVSADMVVSFVFGPKYGTTANILRVLFLCAPFLYLWLVCFSFASALHIEVKIVRVMVVGVVANAILNLVGIYLLGIQGAAWATVTSQTLMTVWLVFLTWRQLQISKQAASIAPHYVTTVLE
ncbi:flippase [Chloroflexota bacterium]